MKTYFFNLEKVLGREPKGEEVRSSGAGWRAALLESTLARMPGKEHTALVVAAIALGLMSAYGAIGFRFLLQGMHLVSFGTGEYSIDLLDSLSWWQRLFLPFGGGLLVGLIVTRFAPEVKGSGVPEVMEAVARRGGAIRMRVVAVKAVAAALTIGTGGSAGREGPIVHIGAAIGSAMGQLLKVTKRNQRTFVACAAAAAISATFNAPIAGALFAIEVVLSDMRVASMSPIVIASVVATVVSRHHLGDFPAFEVPGYELVSPRELLLYAGLGVICGLVAVLFIKLMFAFGDLFERSAIPAWLRPAVGGLGVGSIALLFPHVFGVGYETINASLAGSTAALFLLSVLVAKLVATCLSLGSGGSGGIFAPSLVLGAALGSAWGQTAGDLFPAWTAGPGAYALVGMGALVSAATHAPITAILMIFEMTNDYRIIPPLMLSCVVAVLVSSQLNRESIYTEKLARRGVRLYERHGVNLLRSIRVSDVMERTCEQVSLQLPLPELLSKLLTGEQPAAAVLDGEGRYLATVDLSDIRDVLPESEDLADLVVTADVADSSAPFLVPGDTLDAAMRHFGRMNRDLLVVCDSAEGRRVVGRVTRQAVINIYNKRVFQADLAGGFRTLVDAVHGGRSVEVLGGLHLGEIPVAEEWVGKTMRDLDMRRTLGLEVVVVHRPDEPVGDPAEPNGHFPAADLVLERGDRLLVVGRAEVIARLAG